MKIYNQDYTIEYNKDELDLEFGELIPSTRKYIVPEQKYIEEEGHYEVIAEYPETGGKDIEWVVDVKGQPYIQEHEEIEECQVYRVYTEYELKKKGIIPYSDDEMEMQRLHRKFNDLTRLLKESDTIIIEYVEGIIDEEQFNSIKKERAIKREQLKETKEKIDELTQKGVCLYAQEEEK